MLVKGETVEKSGFNFFDALFLGLLKLLATIPILILTKKIL